MEIEGVFLESGLKIQHDFAAIPRHGQLNTRFKRRDRKSVGQDTVNVDEAPLQEIVHRVPRRPHLSAVDALKMQVAEDHLVHRHVWHRFAVHGEDVDVAAHSG